MDNKRISDPRFAHIHKDPRFKSMSKKDKKIIVDKRFKGIFKNKAFSTKPKFDEYGDEFGANNEQYEDHYEEEEEQLEEPLGSEEQEQSGQSDGNEFDDPAADLEVDSEEDDEDDDIGSLMGADEWKEDEEKVPEVAEATSRLALQNYDWQSISAKDLMVLFSSFVPSGHSIKRIAVYQSQFGKERMEAELIHGPKDIFKENFVQPEVKKKSLVREINELVLRGDQQDLDVDPNKLRKYEKDRLKYYYAIIECEDSSQTADNIYKATNQQEFELSNIKIDLRFVPDDMTFTGQPYQECDKLTQQLGTKNIISRASGHTSVKLTWDEDVPKANFWQGKTEEELDKIDWNEYLGDCGDEEIEDVQDFKEKLFSKNEADGADWKQSFNKKAKQKKRAFDIEITFNTGFNEAGNSILNKETKKKKSRFAQEMKTDDLFVGFEKEPDEEDPATKSTYAERKLERKAKLRQQRANQKAQQQNKAELELLVDSKPKRDEGTFDPQDKRFEAAYSNPQYAIDPTDRHFKKETVGKAFEEQVRRKRVKY